MALVLLTIVPGTSQLNANVRIRRNLNEDEQLYKFNGCQAMAVAMARVYWDFVIARHVAIGKIIKGSELLITIFFVDFCNLDL